MKKQLIIIGSLVGVFAILLVGYFAFLLPYLNRETAIPTDAYHPVTGEALRDTLYFVEGTYTQSQRIKTGDDVSGLYTLDKTSYTFAKVPSGTSADGKTAYYAYKEGGYTLVSPLPDGFDLSGGNHFVYGVFTEAAGIANGSGSYYTEDDGVYRSAGKLAVGTALENHYTFTGAKVTIDSLEQLTAGGLFLMYPRTERTNMQSIEVTNEHGSYRFYRDESDNFIIDGFEDIPYDLTAFSALVSTVGYTSTSSRICCYATEEQLREYGLDEPQATWTMTNIYGDVFSVEVGDALLDQSGYYYCRMVGRDAIYTMSMQKPIVTADYSNVSYREVILESIETLVTPILSMGLTTNNYYMVDNVMLLDENLELIYLVRNTINDTTSSSTTDNSIPGKADALSDPTFAYPAGYQINSTLFWNTIYTFASGAFSTECVLLGAEVEDLEAYGILNPYRVFTFDIREQNGTNAAGKPVYETLGRITLGFSTLQEDGTYYVNSSLYPDIIAKVSAEQFSFIESPTYDWISKTIFPENIVSIEDIRIHTPSRDVTFLLEHGLESSTYVDSNGQIQTQYTNTLEITTSTGMTITDEETQNFRQLYITLLTITIKGEHGLTPEEQDAIMADESRWLMSFSYTPRNGETVDLDFYYYTQSGRRVLVAVDGETEFYVLADDISEIATSVEQLLSGIRVDPYAPQ